MPNYVTQMSKNSGGAYLVKDTAARQQISDEVTARETTIANVNAALHDLGNYTATNIISQLERIQISSSAGATNPGWVNATNRLSIRNFLYTYSDLMFGADNNDYEVLYWKSDASGKLIESSGWKKSITIPAGTYFYVTFRKANNAEYTIIEGQEHITVNDLKMNVYNLISPVGIKGYILSYLDHYQNGSPVGSGVWFAYSPTRLTTKELLYTDSEINILMNNNVNVIAIICDSNDTITSLSSWAKNAIIPANSYYHLSFALESNSFIDYDDVFQNAVINSDTSYKKLSEYMMYVKELINGKYNSINYYRKQFANVGHGVNVGSKIAFVTSTNRVSFPQIAYTPNKIIYRVAIEKINNFDVTGTIVDKHGIVISTFNWSKHIEIPANSYFVLTSRKTDNSDVTVSEIVDQLEVIEENFNQWQYIGKKTDDNENLISLYRDQISNVISGSDDARSSFPKNITIAMISDTHDDMMEIGNAIAISEGVSSIDGVLHLGDMDAGNAVSPSSVSPLVGYLQGLDFEKPFFPVMGNHDEQYTNEAGTVEKAVSDLIPTLNTANVYNSRGYGYYDFTAYNIRLIILNSFDYPSTKTDDNYDFVGDNILYQQAQVDFFVNALLTVPEDYTVIVASHWPESGTIINSIIDQHPGSHGITLDFRWEDADTKVGQGTYMSGHVMSDIINAYKNRTSIIKNYTAESATKTLSISVDADFSSANGEFAIWLTGHRHRACVARSDVGNYLIYVNDTSAITWPTANSDTPRKAGTASRDLITCLSIDSGNKIVNLIRIGAHINRFLDDSNMITLHYNEE